MRNGDVENAAPPALTELEQALQGPDSTSVADAIILRLEDVVEQIAAYLRAGPSPANHTRAVVIREALVAARSVVLGALVVVR